MAKSREPTLRKKIGGPPKREPKPGERAALSLRMSPDLKRRLDAAAESNGRSQSQEAEFRLERSFDRQDLLPDVLTTAYRSTEFAALLMLVGEAMMNAGYFARTMGLTTRQAVLGDVGAWLSDPYAFDQAAQAANAILERFRPPGDPTNLAGKDLSLVERAMPQGGEGESTNFDDFSAALETLDALADFLRSRRDEKKSGGGARLPSRLDLLGADIAHDMLEHVCAGWRHSPASSEFADLARTVRALLGPTVERIAKPKPALDLRQEARLLATERLRNALRQFEQHEVAALSKAPVLRTKSKVGQEPKP